MTGGFATPGIGVTHGRQVLAGLCYYSYQSAAFDDGAFIVEP
jgi:hypothetical protein